MFAKSCATNILETLDIITSGIDNHYEVIMILLDFAKAFDKVSHQFLLVKLKEIGFDDKTIKWISWTASREWSLGKRHLRGKTF